MKPEPCVAFACQLEAMSDEDLAGMMELMEEESLLELEESPGPPCIEHETDERHEDDDRPF